MSIAATAHPLEAVPHAPRPLRSLERFRGSLLWLTGFSGAFVFMEPSPYEIASLLTIVVFALTGLTLRPALIPLIILLILWNIGFSMSLVQVLDYEKRLIWVLVSWYMALTSIFFAAMLGGNTRERLTLLMRGFMVAAVVASIAGIIGYFQLIPRFSNILLAFGRARGTFNDPNVFGAFLVLPALLALQHVLSDQPWKAVRNAAAVAIFTFALLLSFSRGAWGHFAFSAVVMLVLTFITSHSARERVRIIGLAVIGILALAIFVTALLSIDAVADLFKERASLDQSYDTGHTGRFGRHVLGFSLALETPLGIGPLQFGRIFPEDPQLPRSAALPRRKLRLGPFSYFLSRWM